MSNPAIPPFPPSWDYIDMFSIHLGYFQVVHRADFWSYVRKFGSETSFLGPRIERSRRYIPDKEAVKGFWNTGFTHSPLNVLDLFNLIKLPVSVPPTQQDAILAENTRRIRAGRIYKSVKAARKTQQVASTLPARAPNQNPAYQPFADQDPTIGQNFTNLKDIIPEILLDIYANLLQAIRRENK